MNDTGRGGLLQLFVDDLPDVAVILLDTHGNVLTWNAGAQAILGYAPHEIVGRHFSHLHTKDDIAAGKPSGALGAAVAAGRHEDTVKIARNGGAELEVASVVMPLYDSQRKLVGFGSLMRPTGAMAAFVAIPDPISRRRNEKILVVDDDERVREVALLQLTSLGYDVVVASSGPEALEVLGRVADIDLLFTDVMMPGGMNGREVADEARKRRPGIKVLFTSGYFEGALVRQGSIESSVRVLVKPYRKKDLAEKVQEVLSAAAA